MPKGRIIFAIWISVCKTKFRLSIKKLAYLKYPRIKILRVKPNIKRNFLFVLSSKYLLKKSGAYAKIQKHWY